MMMAARCGSAGAIQALLATRGADIDVNATAGEGSVTALTLAAAYGHTDAIKALLAAGAIAVNHTMSNGLTPLMLAAREDHADAVSALLGSEAIDANALRNLFFFGSPVLDTREGPGGTALMVAAHFGHQRTVDALLASGKVDADLAGSGGITPLMPAAVKCHEAVVAALLATGQVDLRKRDELNEWTAFEFASQAGHDSVAQLLRAQRVRH
jgi:ankyrin repeat protein